MAEPPRKLTAILVLFILGISVRVVSMGNLIIITTNIKFYFIYFRCPFGLCVCVCVYMLGCPFGLISFSIQNNISFYRKY